MTPKFSHIEHWIFDLDNTLYPPSLDIFAGVDKKITAYMCQKLDMTEQEAEALQNSHFEKHGTTLWGLLQEKQDRLDREEFIALIHDADFSKLTENQALKHALSQLTGERLIFTNGSRHHAEAVLSRLGITSCFDNIFDIYEARFRPKPHKQTYEDMVRFFALNPKKSLCIDDTARNLLPAHELGMETLWVEPDIGGKESDKEYQKIAFWQSNGTHITHRTDNLIGFLQQAALG